MTAPAEVNFLDKGIELVQRAIGEDDKRNYPEAYDHYMNAIDHFMAAQKFEKNEKSKLFLQSKADEYLNRAETIKQYIQTEQAQQSIVDKAIEFAKQAIEEDIKQNYRESYKQYMNALDYFMLAQKYETNEKSKSLIRVKMEGYLSRAETIKKHMQALEDSRTTSSANEGGRQSLGTPQTTFLHKAIEIAERACDEDTKRNLPEADKLYKNALDYFMLALKYEKNEQSKVVIRANIEEYLTRAEVLKKRMAE
ncbi:hypothetical protein HYDPIDRAFT_42140 [Hydnomerulius pinastri MD-312]|uniref:vesicle-fusing ATPase n=1 Tax=Hydnomerulius pinastri MD-312 TaxID=994086 RepID=A0A0C9WCG4_9AGAM|nr:hypothetical protein HYDPIDRAFT_42140 [Hydnomerulius pinastri MD-312]